MIKTLKKLGLERNFLNLIEGIYEKLRANIILNGETLVFLPKIRKKTKIDVYSHHSYSTLYWRF